MTEVPMIDWYSSLLCSHERQRDLLQQAERRRLLEAARDRGRKGKSAGRPERSAVRRHAEELLRPLEQGQP